MPVNVSEKWEQVYHAIPDNGSPIRFNEITEKTELSPTTISAALTYFCYNGLIKKKVKSKKNVLYSRTKPTYRPPEAVDYQWTCLYNEYGEYGFDDLEKVYLHVANTRFPYQHDLLLQLKEKGKYEDLKTFQIMILNEALRSIDQRLISALQDYVKEPNKEKAMIDFNNEIKLHHVPTLKELIKFVDDIGLDNDVRHMLGYKMRQRLDSQDMEHLKEYQERKQQTQT